MFFDRKKDKSFDEKIKKMMVKAVDDIKASDELKLKIKKRIDTEIDFRNNVLKQNESWS